MSVYRGDDWRDDQKANIEIELFTMFQTAFLNGKIDEKPITPADELYGKGTGIILYPEEGEPYLTVPDFRWMSTEYRLRRPVYLHGPPHRSYIIERRDAENERLLWKQNYEPIVISYTDNTKAVQREIFDDLVERLRLRRA